MEKEYKIRFIKSDDFAHLIKWWKHYDHCEVPTVDLLPNYGMDGYVVEKNGKPIMAAFMYLTNSAIGYLDYLVRDPDYNEKDKNNMLWDLQEACGKYLLSRGCTMVWGMTSYETIANMAEKIGHDVLDDKYYVIYIHQKIHEDMTNKK